MSELGVLDIKKAAEELWRANKSNNEALAAAVFRDHALPPAAPILIPNLAALLVDLQRRSFLLGVAAVLAAAEVYDEREANAQKEGAPPSTVH